MVRAQKWLNESCPQEIKKTLKKLDLRNLNLEGDLDLERFAYHGNLQKIYLAGNPSLGEIKNKPHGTILIYQTPQELLNLKYSDKKRVEKIELNYLDFEQPSELTIDNYPNLKEIGGRNVSNLINLTIVNCPQLEEMNISYLKNAQQLILNNLVSLGILNCSWNNLTTLDLTNCVNLQRIYCPNNHLTKIKFTNYGEKLEYLNLSNNNLNQDFYFLKNLVNLKSLNLSNNEFYGSLEFLKDMKKLEWLDISDTSINGSLKPLQQLNKLKKINIFDTDIDSGLEYLPESVGIFRCSVKKRPEAECQSIFNLFSNAGIEVEVDEYGYIESFPQKLQEYKQKIEWKKLNLSENWHKNCIPYKQLEIEKDEKGNNKVIGKGGFGKVYKAKWKSGEVALKSLNNSRKEDFLKEAAYYKLFNETFSYIIKFFGISQDPDGNYLMVMQYGRDGNLRDYLDNKYRGLDFKIKLSKLVNISEGLNSIHSKNLVHQDFHAGNILNNNVQSYIADLGLCKPVDETNQKNVYGVMPYIAPEVLRSQPYTQKADVYSFGIIAYEILSGLPPYYDTAHDIQLALAVCQGQRPQFQIKIPQLLEDLIKKCWDGDPAKRPAASELERILRSWQGEINNQSDTEFTEQLQETEEFNRTLLEEVKYPDYKKRKHSEAVYHSRLLPTKEITQILSQSQEVSSTIYLEKSSDLESCAILSVDQQAFQVQPAYGIPGSSKNN